MTQATAPDKPLPEIPDKLYFRIGEVARLAGVKPYVLRYWESEFPLIEPKKSGTNHRLYRRKDVETILEIKRLLYEKRFTIEGARKHLTGGRSKSEAPKPPAQSALFESKPSIIKEIKKELEAIVKILS